MTGKKLHNILKDSDINFAKLAAKLNLTPQALNNRFKSKDVTTSFLIEVAEILNKDVYELMDQTAPTNKNIDKNKPKYIEQRVEELERRLKELEKNSNNT